MFPFGWLDLSQGCYSDGRTPIHSFLSKGAFFSGIFGFSVPQSPVFLITRIQMVFLLLYVWLQMVITAASESPFVHRAGSKVVVHRVTLMTSPCGPARSPDTNC